MKITKYGQCCLLIEVDNKRILTDPGKYTAAQNTLTDLDLILITHEHADHLHTDSLREILANNPNAVVVTNSGVGKILDEHNISYQLLEGDTHETIADIALEAHDGKHAEIFGDYGQVQNTGYFIAEQLFYPGDAYTNPQKPVPTLALPVGGPWCKSADAIAYAHEVAPKKAFPVHDWLLNEDGIALTYKLFESQLSAKNIEFVPLQNDETKEF